MINKCILSVQTDRYGAFMFYFSQDEIDALLSSHETDNFCSYFASVFTKARNQYKPLFFTPYRTTSEFAGELVAPLVDPIRLAGITASAGLAAIIASAAILGSLLVAGVVTLCMNTKARDSVLDFTCNLITFLGAGLITAATCLFLSIASIPHGLASLVTRSATTIGSLISKKEEDLESANELSAMSP